MKLRKMLLFAVACLSVLSAGAQKVVSRSRIAVVIKEEKPPKEKVNYPYNFFVKAGGGVNLYHRESWEYSTKPVGIYNVSLGWQKQCNSHGLYWGAQLGVSSMIVANSIYKSINYTVQTPLGKTTRHDSDDYMESKGRCVFNVGPLFGIKKGLSSTLTFDGHIGASYCVEFSKHNYHETYVYGDGKLYHSAIWQRLAQGPMWELGLGLWIKRFLVELEYRGAYDTSAGRANTGILLNAGFKF